MKTILSMALLLLLAIYSNAQPLQLSRAENDSLSRQYKRHKTTGLVLLPVGGAVFVAGAFVMLSAGLSEAGDGLSNAWSEAWGGSGSPKKDYSGQYTGGGAMMLVGGIAAIIGATQLSAAHKIRKKMNNASISFKPTSVPSLVSAGHTTRIPQSTVSIKIPIGK